MVLVADPVAREEESRWWELSDVPTLPPSTCSEGDVCEVSSLECRIRNNFTIF